jgi:hypothetical protein
MEMIGIRFPFRLVDTAQRGLQPWQELLFGEATHLTDPFTETVPLFDQATKPE